MELKVKRAKSGDKEALLELILEEKDNYYKLAFVYMRNEEDSLDVIQDMIIILYKEINKLKNLDSFYSWSKTILVNLCKKELKLKKKNEDFMGNLKIEYKNSENKEELLEAEDKIYLSKLIEKLNEKQKEIIKLRYYLDYSYEEISIILDIPLGTVKSRINKGLNKIKKDFGGELEVGYR